MFVPERLSDSPAASLAQLAERHAHGGWAALEDGRFGLFGPGGDDGFEGVGVFELDHAFECVEHGSDVVGGLEAVVYRCADGSGDGRGDGLVVR